MSEIHVKIEALSKRYQLGNDPQRERYTALRDVLLTRAVSTLKRLQSPSRPTAAPKNEFWALRDVSFEVRRGQVVGIIGRNGAGKSTLLKILSRITEPTSGRIRMSGRVASLLEVGTGFHPELTGRENVFLNGAILGMSRAEIRRKFDEIVTFAEVERFLDTPIKRYSSGMYVRLAFAVAAHLEPDLLIVDEVLAVGDMQFQQKCIGKMQSAADAEGRTVIFVSHNMETVLRLCQSAVLLSVGKVAAHGDTRSVVSAYLNNDGYTAAARWSDAARQPGDDAVRLLGVAVHGSDGKPAAELDTRSQVGISLTYRVLRDDVPLVDDVNVINEEGRLVFAAHNVASNYYNKTRLPGLYRSTAWIPGNLLTEGGYSITAGVITLSPFCFHARAENAVSVRLVDTMSGHSARGVHAAEFPGVIRPLLRWDVAEAFADSADVPQPLAAAAGK